MLIGMRGAGCLNSIAEEQYRCKPSLVLKGQPYFYNPGPTSKFKSVLRIWRPPTEKVQEIKSNSCARHHYDIVFIGERDKKMGLVIGFMFYKLALSRFLSKEEEVVLVGLSTSHCGTFTQQWLLWDNARC